MTWSPDSLDPTATLALRDQIRPLYRSCFSGPPWNEPEEKLATSDHRLSQAVCRAGFQARAVRSPDGTLLALAYGWPTPPSLTGCDVYERLIAAIGPAAARDLTRDAFEIAELMVTPTLRRRGIGTALLTAMTTYRPRTWLVTRTDSPAAHLYTRTGWQQACALPETNWAVFTWTAPR